MSYLIPPLTEARSSEINISDNQNQSASYYFDGVDDVIQGTYAAFKSNLFSVMVELKLPSLTASQCIWTANASGSERIIVRILNGAVQIYDEDVAAFTTVIPSGSLVAGKTHRVGIVSDGANVTGFVDGRKIATIAYVVSGQSTNRYQIGSRTGTDWLTGEIMTVKFFNFAMSDAQMIAVMKGQKPDFAFLGANGIPATSGTLVIGKQYRINSFQAGDDFTNVGAASNASGVVFIATGTTPTTWTNSSAVVQQGLVLDLEPDTMAPARWYDKSGNNYHGSHAGGVTLLLANVLVGNVVVSMTNLPTSSAGLTAGRVWNDAGTLKVVT